MHHKKSYRFSLDLRLLTKASNNRDVAILGISGFQMGSKKCLFDGNFVLVWRVLSYTFNRQPALKLSGAHHVFPLKVPILIARALLIMGRASQTTGQALGLGETLYFKTTSCANVSA